MMFPWNWNIAKSAEEILCRYAVKRLCKFLLKKKLGQFILGDIDLDNLDVQLSSGLLNLTNLALNVDFLNHKLGQSSIFRVKEGSIRSLLVKLPWSWRGSGQNCEVEVDEIELVLELFPCEIVGDDEVARTHDLNSKGGFSVSGDDLVKIENDLPCGGTAASINVHEGVKTIAKMVKKLLMNFCITVKNVIIAFDFDQVVERGNKGEEEEEGFPNTLVLRVAEIECGACVSDSEERSSEDGEDFLGMGASHFTNFCKFQGAAIELVHMNGYNASKLLLSGEKGGFGGNVKLSIPWKNGSLDTHKMDAEFNVEAIIAKLQPSTLNWMLLTLDLLENYNNNRKYNNVNHMSVFNDSTSHCSPSSDVLKPECEEIVTDGLFKESPFISDWVPLSTTNCEIEGAETVDLGASVDQFFECLDEMRNFQFMGSTGMWGLTCSVFSAISTASNLASGSFNVSAGMFVFLGCFKADFALLEWKSL